MHRADKMYRPTLITLAALGFAACGGAPENDAAEETYSVPVAGEGIPIPVTSDSANYYLLRWEGMPNGNREALTRRDGRSGTSYARREINCRAKAFRYLGEGDTRAEAEADAPNRGPMAELVPGSISSEVSEFVCRQ